MRPARYFSIIQLSNSRDCLEDAFIFTGSACKKRLTYKQSMLYNNSIDRR